MGTLLDIQQQGLCRNKNTKGYSGWEQLLKQRKADSVPAACNKGRMVSIGEGMGLRRNPGTEQTPTFNLETQTTFRLVCMH